MDFGGWPSSSPACLSSFGCYCLWWVWRVPKLPAHHPVSLWTPHTFQGTLKMLHNSFVPILWSAQLSREFSWSWAGACWESFGLRKTERFLPQKWPHFNQHDLQWSPASHDKWLKGRWLWERTLFWRNQTGRPGVSKRSTTLCFGRDISWKRTLLGTNPKSSASPKSLRYLLSQLFS